MKTDDRKRMNCELTKQQIKFAHEWALDENGTAAALRAGYSKSCAAVVASRLLRNPLIKKLVKEVKAKAAKKLGLERDVVLDKLACNLHRRGIRQLAPNGIFVTSLDDIPDEAFAFIDGFEVTQMFGEDREVIGQKIKIKLSPNASAQDMALKVIGAYAAEKHEITGKAVLDYEEMSRPTDLREIDAVSKRLEAEDQKAIESSVSSEGSSRREVDG